MIVAALLLLTGVAYAPSPAAAAPAMDCVDVVSLELSGVTIRSATVVSTGPAPYCEVRGTIAPANTIVLRLPIEGWSRRYVQTGCGGLCGNATINYGQAAGCRPIVDGTVASATTDMGHQGQNDAANFVAYTPRKPVRDDYSWVGERLYSHGYQTWPRAVDGKLVLR